MEAHQHVEIFQETDEEKPDVEDLRKQSSMAPVIKMVNLIISEAVEHKASDIHLDPRKKDLVVRYRVDGLLRQSFLLPKWVQGALVSRIKIMASMDIAEKRLPQDGRIAVAINKRMLDLRVSTLPTKSGEKVVIRVLHTSNATLPAEQLGLEGKRHRDFLSIISRPQGILLVTGPTGSGKTTTMYTALSTIKSEEKNIVTVEDPVEYELEGISQVSVNEKVGLTFANALRSILRQDPDVVMVGEMRDIDTATIAMQASLTGHLVLSTVHTNDAVSTITRLRNLGIPSYLIASSMIGIIGQRLVRILCPDCKETDNTKNQELIRLGLRCDHSQDATFYKATGCTRCGGIGYAGRTGIYEVLLFDEEVKELITAEAPESEIRKAVLAGGMETLVQAGLEKVHDGATSLQELVRVMFVDKDLGPSSSIRAVAMNE
jgi:type II secretory ATPase GspE/PulE/Tfp pilus assembly ATPase PilB-like protein